MAEAGTLCINGDVEKKSGLNGNSTADGESYTNVYIKMAEGNICAQSCYDWVANYASVSTIGKEFLRDVVSSLAAIYVITYDMKGYTSRTEAQTMLDVNWSIVAEGINLLRDNRWKDFVLKGDLE